MITIQRDLLLERLNVLEKGYATKTTNPALQYLKFENGKLTMSDGSIIIVTSIDYDTDLTENEDIKVLIPFKMLKEITTKLNTNAINFSFENGKIQILSNKSHYTLNTIEFTEYPNISIAKLENAITLNGEQFKCQIANVVFANDVAGLRPILQGVNLTLKENKLSAVATDSYRLAKHTIDAVGNDFNFTIHAKDMQNLLKMIPKEDFEIRYDEKNIIFNLGDILYKTRLLDGNYPSVDRIIPTSFSTQATVDKLSLLEAIKRVVIFAPNDKDAVRDVIKLNFKKNELNVICDNSILGNAIETLDCTCDFDDEFEIGIKGGYLIDALNCYNGGDIQIKMNSQTKPLIVNDDIATDTIQLILPVKID